LLRQVCVLTLWLRGARAQDKTGNPVYTINDTSVYPTSKCTSMCPTDAVPFIQNNQNNALVMSTVAFGACGSAGAVGCASAVASSFMDIANDPDHMSMLAVGGLLYSVVQFESANPAAMYGMQLSVSVSGDLGIVPGTLTPIDFSAYGGLVSPCAGSTTPWQSHLGSEESVGIDARDFAGTFFPGTVTNYNTVSLSTASMFMRYFGIYPAQLTAANLIANFDPYMYGFINEVSVTGVNTFRAAKRFAIGRAAWEMALVLPDNRTVYPAADRGNGLFTKFVANTAGDLSAGVMSCAAFTQTSPVNSVGLAAAVAGGSFNIKWVTMSATNDATILAAVNGTTNGVAAQLTFDDIFISDLPTSNVSGACNTGFTSINTGYTYTVAGVKYYNECLQLNTATPNVVMLAAALETVRYAAMLGCTTEFNKMEVRWFCKRALACNAPASRLTRCVLPRRASPTPPSATRSSSPCRTGPAAPCCPR
jgi:hypothetical protein